MYGFNGKVLFVDLTTGSIKEESLPEKTYRQFVGGQGLGARILYGHMKPKADPLGPDNMIGFVTGLLTGFNVHGARFQIVAKSPVTGGWGDANIGGSFAAELKGAGYDGVFFTGISPKPVYLFLDEGKAELRDASAIWGSDTVMTESGIRDELGDKRIKVTCIGPAGEKQSLLAAIIHEGCAAARDGLASVMGSKRLKAVAARGNKKAPLAQPEQFSTLRKQYLQSVKETDHPFVPMFKQWGTCSFVSPHVTSGGSPVKNFQLHGEESFPTHGKLNGDEVTKYQVKKHGCLGCPMGCKGWLKVEDSPYGVIEGTKPEYETLIMMGSNCLIDDVVSIIKANDLCNRYGLDTIGVGASIAFAMECWERGVISEKDTDGIKLNWGDAEAMVKMVEKIGKREGFGAVLADGPQKAASRLGQGSEEWAIHTAGTSLPAHDPRQKLGHAWGYVCDPSPSRHTCSTFIQWHAMGAPFWSADIIPQSDLTDAGAGASVWALCSDLERLWWAAGLCEFGICPDSMPLIELITAATGWDFTLEEGLKAGRRIQTLRQAFNIREGVSTDGWRLPKRLEAAMPDGPAKDTKLDFKAMKENGYRALGWDPKTGKPLDSSLEGLELKELVGTYS
ncbi:MAG TPA: aldehyde ferredoxin oxidoreductase family protein [Dehalococcoidia bacterium]|nr:aldehyde ferredoxin oxidoreductase family protein [Dehalococcoidia bacterium]